MGNDVLAVLYGLASAACWGTADFSGGLASRRTAVYGVVSASTLLGTALLGGLALLMGESLPAGGVLGYGAAAGICGTIGLLALYQGLATGRMGVVAPVAAVATAALPVLAAAGFEGLPAPSQLAGFALALVAVWLVARGDENARLRVHDLGLPVLAGIGFGLFLILIDRSTTADPGSVLWPLAMSRAASLVIVLSVAVTTRRRAVPPPAQWPIVALASVMDAGGNAFYALATRAGRLDVSAVLSSLYPAATVLLAWIVLHERLAGRQWLGVAAALAAIVLITL